MPGPEFPARGSLAHPDLIDTIHVGLAENRFHLATSDGSEHLEVRVGTEKTPPADYTMVTWTADDQVPYYCIEPWMGPPNSPEHQRGLEWVTPGQTGHFAVSVAIG
jgi:galactose mutarotase-like enzyme